MVAAVPVRLGPVVVASTCGGCRLHVHSAAARQALAVLCKRASPECSCTSWRRTGEQQGSHAGCTGRSLLAEAACLPPAEPPEEEGWQPPACRWMWDLCSQRQQQPRMQAASATNVMLLAAQAPAAGVVEMGVLQGWEGWVTRSLPRCLASCGSCSTRPAWPSRSCIHMRWRQTARPQRCSQASPGRPLQVGLS